MLSKRATITTLIALVIATVIVISSTIAYTYDYNYIEDIKTKIIDKFGNEEITSPTSIPPITNGQDNTPEATSDAPEKSPNKPEPEQSNEKPSTATTNEGISQLENAVIFSLVRNSELQGMINSIKFLEQRFNKNYHYPWYFANDEPFTEEFKEKITEVVSGEAKFITIPTEYWSYPDFIDQEKAKKSREQAHSENIMYGSSESYRHMCRFNSGFFYKLKELEEIDYYWRVEPDVKFKCDIKFDPFKQMREEGKLYGFNMGLAEDSRTIRSLWGNVVNFFKENPKLLSKPNNLKFISDDEGNSYNLCHFWSNFEIGDLKFFRSEAYESFFQYLDKKGGFFYERWGDAPFHTIAVSLMLPPDKLMFVPYTGYYHKPNQDCPRSEQIRQELNCNCQPSRDFTWHKWSCINKYFEVNELEKLNAGIEKRNGDFAIHYEPMDNTLNSLLYNSY